MTTETTDFGFGQEDPIQTPFASSCLRVRLIQIPQCPQWNQFFSVVILLRRAPRISSHEATKPHEGRPQLRISIHILRISYLPLPPSAQSIPALFAFSIFLPLTGPRFLHFLLRILFAPSAQRQSPSLPAFRISYLKFRISSHPYENSPLLPRFLVRCRCRYFACCADGLGGHKMDWRSNWDLEHWF